MKKILVILGPTGSGKSEVAVQLAEHFQGEVINADSRQVYQELNIGTAKPDPALLSRVPHHLYGFLPIDAHWDASLFQKKADQAIGESADRGHLPVIAGGTGLHLRALIFGLFDGPPADPKIRKQLEERIQKEGLMALHQELRAIDLDSARIIHPNDPVRVVRALEVYQITGKPISAHQKEHAFREPRYNALRLALHMDRQDLYSRINQRVLKMVEEGLEEEVRSLVAKWGRQSILAEAIGYKEWFGYLDGEKTKDEVITEIQQNSRHYAKRQLTWFKKEKDVKWFGGSDLEGMENAVRTFLAG